MDLNTRPLQPGEFGFATSDEARIVSIDREVEPPTCEVKLKRTGQVKIIPLSSFHPYYARNH